MIGIRAVAFSAAAALWLSIVASMAAGQQGTTTQKQAMIEKGLQYETAWDLYQALKEEAGGGERLTWDNLPDWSGVYMRSGPLNFDPDQPRGSLPTAKLTPEYHAAMMDRIEKTRQGIQFDPISTCEPPGHPRWLNMPFLRDHIVTPDQTTMIAEAYNLVRRIYTDGRGHMPEEERYPLHLGDSIGFWDGDSLVTHTNQLMAHYYERTQPDYSDQVETVEIWRKVSDRVLEADVWVYDPPVLAEPWYTKQTYMKFDDPEKILRIRHFDCKSNPNNDVQATEDGNSDFVDFTFTDVDDR